MVGNYTSANDISWTVTINGSGGADVVDPPLTNFFTVPSVDLSAAADGVNGTIAFTDTDSSNPQSFTSDGSGSVSSFSLDPTTEKSVGFEFSLDNDQINFASAQTLIQSDGVATDDAQNPAVNLNYPASVSIGGPGNDNFVFQPGIGADIAVNLNPRHDAIELNNFSNAQTVQQLQSLVTADAHGDAGIGFAHNDITQAGMDAMHLQQFLHSVVHLH